MSGSLGTSMNYNLVSGMVLKGTDKASELSQRLVDECFKRRGHCGIVIANASSHCLTEPHRYLYSGSIGTLPMNIPSGSTGLITASKTFGSPWGTSGVLTYNIDELPYRLQIFWTVPIYTIAEDIKVNVNVGNLYANEDLYDSLINNQHGELIRARNTAHVYKMKKIFLAEVYMGDTGRSPLTIIFRNDKLGN